MNDQISEQTKRLRKQYVRTFHNDGLLDFFVGWALVSAGIFLITEKIIFSFAGWMPILLIQPLKQKYIIPRFGYAKFSKPSLIPRPLLIGAGLIVITSSLLINFLNGVQGYWSPIIIGLLGLALTYALDKGWNRTTVYAIFIPVFFIVGLGLDLLNPTIIILVGGVLMALGIYLFMAFLKQYPNTPGEENSEA